MKTYIKIPFSEKDEAKRLGARWDGDAKSWYIPDGVNKKPFQRWMPGAEQPGLGFGFDEPRPSAKQPESKPPYQGGKGSSYGNGNRTGGQGGYAPRTPPRNAPAPTQAFDEEIFLAEPVIDMSGCRDEEDFGAYDDPYAGMPEPGGFSGGDWP